MLVFKAFRAELPRIPDAAFQTLNASVPQSIRSLMYPARELQAQIIGVAADIISSSQGVQPTLYQFDPRSGMIDAEVLTNGSDLFVVAVELRDQDHLPRSVRSRATASAQGGEVPCDVHLYYIGPTVDCPQLETVERAVNEAFNVTLAPELFRSDRFKALQQEGRASPAPPDATELAASHALSGRGIRTLAVAIKSSGGLLVGDLSKQLSLEDRGRTEEFRKTLESTGLVGSEIVVVCMKTQGQIARAPSEDVLRAMSDQGVKCACGRPISNERIEKAVTITDLGRALLDGNRWLTLLLLEELREVGIPLGNTLIEQQVGGDEIDCLADISGELAFFELKDKDFNLGNAYSFGAKMGIIRPRHPVIFSTTKVGNDAREHFERARSAGRSRYEEMYLPEDPSPEIRYIEGVECLRIGIQELATAIHRGDALRVLRRVLPFAALDAGALLSALEHQGHKRAATEVICGREVEHTCDPGAEALVSEELMLSTLGAVAAVTAQ